MGASEHEHTQARIAQYLTGKIKEAFPEDFHLIERLLPSLIERYSLKELIIIIRLEIDHLKNGRRIGNRDDVPPLG